MRRIGDSRFLFLLFFSFCALAQDLTPEIRADINRRVDFQRNWDTRLSSPGARLQGVEVQREKYPGGYIVRYEFKADGLPTDMNYEFLTVPTMGSRPQEIQSSGDVSIEAKSGRVIDGPDDPRSVILPHPAPGEPYRFALVSKDGKNKAAVTLLPNPVEGSDHDCRVNVIRMTPKFELAFVQITGFPPQADIDFRGNSEGEIHDGKMKTNSQGYADSAILPFKLGKPRGKMALQFTSASCSPKVAFKWGSNEQGGPYQ